MISLHYPPGATPLDPEEAEGLKLAHITTQQELNRWEQNNISEADSWLRRMRRTDILSEDFLRALHRHMLGKVWHWAGKFRRTEKNIGVAWIKIPTELRTLLHDMQYWIEHATFPPDEIATRFHHRLVSIHLFPNGNGRHARMATDALLIKLLKAEPFTWGQGNLVTPGETRSHYIQGLQDADRGDYLPLLAFVRS